MAAEILINAGAGEIRAARIEDGRLQDLAITRVIGDGRSRIGDVVLGRVSKVMPGMQAAFVEIGMTRAGFLALREARSLARGAADRISDCVREGEAVLVQVIKDPLGEKGARLSAAIALPGRLLVMTPGQPGIAVSRRIEDTAARASLTARGETMRTALGEKLAPGAGFVFRTAALDAAPDELAADALALAAIWHDIEAQRKSARPPAILYNDLGPIERSLRGMMRGDVARVLIDDAAAAETARAYCRRAMPAALEKIAFMPEALFDRHELEEEIAGLAQPRVPLASGAWITIEATEALTAIDVNSGGFTESVGLEATSLAVNLEAAAEIGRQLRLRDIGGLIVVDFIQLQNAAHTARVLHTLTDSLTQDNVPVQISPMTEFGIVAITRKRVRASLSRMMHAPCAGCGGSGEAATAESKAMEILRRIEREGRANPGREIAVRAAPAVAQWLAAHDGELRAALSRRGVGRVRFESGGEGFDVRAV